MEKKIIVLLCSIVLFTATSAFAEAPIQQTVQTVSVAELLEHNKRLLEGTTIGAVLRTSSNKEASALYYKAMDLAALANEAHQKGSSDWARSLVSKSTHKIYAADAAHWGMYVK